MFLFLNLNNFFLKKNILNVFVLESEQLLLKEKYINVLILEPEQFLIKEKYIKCFCFRIWTTSY